jgi:hypothetical protein
MGRRRSRMGRSRRLGEGDAFFAWRRFVFLLWFFGVLAFPCFVSGLLALPLCGAAPPFFAAAKKGGKESRFEPPAHKRVPRAATVVVHLESVPSHTPRL